MFALDTNVLLRYLAQDDPKQSAAAERFIDSGSAPPTAASSAWSPCSKRCG